MTRFLFLSSTLLTIFAAARVAHAAETIRLKPGQCIFIGTQEVCAMSPDQAATAEAAKPRPIYMPTCRYGDKTDEPGSKGYALVQIQLKDDGTKTETVVKTYGSMEKDKHECERDAQQLDRRSP